MGRFLTWLKSLFGGRPQPPAPAPEEAAPPELAPDLAMVPSEPLEVAPPPEPEPLPVDDPEPPPPAEPDPVRAELLAEAAAIGLELDDEEEPDEAEVFEDEDEVGDEPDPFVSGDGPALESAPTGNLAERRREARDLALSGEHRIYLSDIAGPGSLAEALNTLLEEGKVTAEFREDGDEGPHLLYRPLS